MNVRFNNSIIFSSLKKENKSNGSNSSNESNKSIWLASKSLEENKNYTGNQKITISIRSNGNDTNLFLSITW